MNILPFVAIFLIIITLSWNGLFSSYKITASTETFLSSYMATHRDIRNQSEKKSYLAKNPPKKETNKTAPKKIHKTQKNTQAKKFVSSREKLSSENAALNISCLFKGKDSKIEETLIALIEELYHDSPFYKEASRKSEHLAKILVSAIIENGKKIEKQPISFQDIVLESKELQDVWYKMLRGCSYFNLKTKEGWPPLTKFVIIHQDKERKPICFKQAPPELLKAYFGKEPADAILQEEQKRHLSPEISHSLLDEKTLAPILTQFGISNTKDHLQFIAHKKTKETILSTDNKTQIALEIDLPPQKL